MNYNYNKFKFNSLGGIMENINLNENESINMSLSEEMIIPVETEEDDVDFEEIKGLKAFWI